MSKIIAIAMSGGVDSSVVAAELIASRRNVFGITMYLHKNSARAVEQAARVCKDLGIEHHVVDLSQDFGKQVIDTFKRYYEKGLTPNPCAFCNRFIKLGLLLDQAMEKGAELIATGHYAINTDHVHLMEATDKTKDQSYFLSLVRRENLQRTIFPLGRMESKSDTRKLAEQYGLPNSKTKDSQDICFIPDNNYQSFLQSISLIPQYGEIIHIETGKIWGKHGGVMNYTVGQRKGLGISYQTPLYVIRIDAKNNIVYVGDRELLQMQDFTICQQNWLVDIPDQAQIQVKLRSSCRKVKAEIYKIDDTQLKIKLLERTEVPVTQGQVCTIYLEEVVLGGGIIN